MGTIYRVIKNQDYTTIATYHLRDKRLTLAAKGLMSILLGDEGDTAYSIADLTQLGPEGKDAISSALKKLEACGYIRKRQLHDAGGRFAENEVLIYESPLTDFPETVEPSAEKPLTENPETVAPESDLELNQGNSNTSKRAIPSKRENKEEIKNPPLDPLKTWPRWKPERFAAFWDFYRHNCRGESRQAALRAWDRLRPDDDLLREIGQALNRQIKTDEWQRKIGIPYASTYLNQRRWEDDVLDRKPQAEARTLEESPGVTYWTEDMDL